MQTKKEQILTTAIRLFHAEGTAIPTARIAKESGVSNGTLFNNFSTKQVLYDNVYLHIKKEISSLFEPADDPCVSIKSLFKNFWNSYIHWAIDNTEKHQTCHLLETAQALSPDIREKVDTVFKEVLDKIQTAQNQKEIINVPTEYLCDVGAALIKTSASYAIFHQLSHSELDDHLNYSFMIFWNGIALSKNPKES